MLQSTHLSTRGRVVLFFIGCFALNAGCSNTNIISFKDPSTAGRKYRKIVVSASFTLKDRIVVENKYVQLLTESGVDAIAEHDIFPPSRDYSNEERCTILKERTADGIFLIRLEDYNINTFHVPGKTTVKTERKLVLHKSKPLAIYNSVEIESPGYDVSSMQLQIVNYLIDVTTQQKIWTACSKTYGGIGSGINELFFLQARAASEQLVADSVCLITSKRGFKIVR